MNDLSKNKFSLSNIATLQHLPIYSILSNLGMQINSKVTNHNVSKPVEALAIKKGNDVILRNLYLFQETIDEVLKIVSDDLRNVFKLRWIDKLTWEEIQEELGLTRSATYRKRNRILVLYTEFRGYYGMVKEPRQ